MKTSALVGALAALIATAALAQCAPKPTDVEPLLRAVPTVSTRSKVSSLGQVEPEADVRNVETAIFSDRKCQ